MLNKLREIHTNYQSFVAFEEPFVESFLSKEVSWSLFSQRISKVVVFIQSSNRNPVFSSIIAWNWGKNCKKSVLLNEVLYQKGMIPYTWTWALEFFQ